ncbi:MAG: hypothetical protein OEY34_10185 [Cyclobacteriaceae bacterium]|nr:hypothetical protein [Cyclobacteriaceae bacterium]
MTFFNDTVSDIFQFITINLELVGLTLAFIEIKLPNTANKIERGMFTAETKVRNFGEQMISHKMFSSLITLCIFVGFFFEIPAAAGFFDEVFPPNVLKFMDYLLYFSIVVTLLVLIGFGVILFGEFMAALNRFSNGKAIGALGVLLASLGLVGEIYQVINILVH